MMRCYRVDKVHELHNERWYEWQEFERFRRGETQEFPQSLGYFVGWLGIPGREEDDEHIYSAQKAGRITREEILNSPWVREYMEMFAEDPPRDIPLEEGMVSMVIVTAITDEAVLVQRLRAMDHHWDVVKIEPVEFDPSCTYVVT